jgi:hypothetical protein
LTVYPLGRQCKLSDWRPREGIQVCKGNPTSPATRITFDFFPGFRGTFMALGLGGSPDTQFLEDLLSSEFLTVNTIFPLRYISITGIKSTLILSVPDETISDPIAAFLLGVGQKRVYYSDVETQSDIQRAEIGFDFDGKWNKAAMDPKLSAATAAFSDKVRRSEPVFPLPSRTPDHLLAIAAPSLSAFLLLTKFSSDLSQLDQLDCGALGLECALGVPVEFSARAPVLIASRPVPPSVEKLPFDMQLLTRLFNIGAIIQLPNGFFFCRQCRLVFCTDADLVAHSFAHQVPPPTSGMRDPTQGASRLGKV